MKNNYIYEYYADIQSGKAIVGKWIKSIYSILIKGLESGEYFFNAKRAGRAIRFIENMCHHSQGRNDLLKLELWQKALISAIFGIVDDEGLRVFREVFIVIARKNGKTLFASAIIAYMTYLDGEYGAEVYCLAPKLDQANIVYNNFFQMIQQEDELDEISKKRRSDIYIEETNSTIRPLAFNAKKSDGFNPHLVINDELASWRGDGGLKQYEVMKSALGARRQPIILSISTAGYENGSIFDELFTRSTRFLEGGNREKRLLPFLYMIDDITKWNDLTELRKANPNMGVSVFESYYKEEIAIAKNSLPKKVEFLTKYCNIKQNSAIAWLDGHTVELAGKAGEGFKIDDFQDCYAVGGIDLSQSVDLTAATVIIEKKGKMYSFTKFFIPASRLEKAQQTDGVPYDIFIQKGIVQLSGENYVDYKDVHNYFLELQEVHKLYILKIGYDKYSAQYLVNKLAEDGFHMDDVHQGENLTPVIREFEGILKDGNFIIVENKLLEWHFLYAALKQNSETRRVRITKIEQRMRIDGLVAVLCAMTVRHKYWEEVGHYLKNED
ncbi:MAG: terminase large subunit [Defluviitaleaceae bacterium]|nr:terminase large subunit [Defluviitaleaceae bacterium]